MKRRPNGFTATCQCGRVVGAMDINRTERAEAGKILGRWLFEGCIVTPQFEGTWCVQVSSCACSKKELQP